MARGSLYPSLHKLEQDGLIVGEWEEKESGRKRRYYHITKLGRAVLASGGRGADLCIMINNRILDKSMDRLDSYLNQICWSIGGPKAAESTCGKNCAHLLDAVEQHKVAELPDEEAVTKAMEEFGRLRTSGQAGGDSRPPAARGGDRQGLAMEGENNASRVDVVVVGIPDLGLVIALGSCYSSLSTCTSSSRNSRGSCTTASSMGSSSGNWAAHGCSRFSTD